jgi:pimeloyl-ACP methyl ester carboxylesterase
MSLLHAKTELLDIVYEDAGGGDAPAEVRRDPVGFARIQWQTWSPSGWFTDSEFAETAKSFRNPDWGAITLHGYRSRWLDEPGDPRYAESQQRLEQIETLSTPTLMIQGAADCCDVPATSEGLERYFRGPYRRIVLEGVGHFPPREAPERVADVLVSTSAKVSQRRVGGPDRRS